MAEATDLTPQEWLARLGPKLRNRQPQITLWRRYYDGDHDLPAGPNQNRDAYIRFQALARTNLCFLCAESRVHRTQVIGYRDPARDEVMWRMWQALKLDARQFGIYRKAYSRSAAYVTVGVDPKRPLTPRVTIEGPENVVVETDPADASRRLAALRLWHDSIARRWMATLYLPGVRHAWQTAAEAKNDALAGALSFEPRAWQPRSDPARSLPDVPVVPFLLGDPDEEPKAAFHRGIDVQNRLNLTLLNRLTSERYAAFRQTLLLNYEVDEDPVTGEPISPYNPGADQVITIPPPDAGNPATTVQSLPQTDTSQMLRGVEADMRAFAAVTITPVYYLPGDLINIGADSIAALDAGHVADIRQSMAYWGEGLEEVMQLMADVAELGRDLSTAEVVWARPENFNPAQVADYASKLKAAGVPLPLVAEEIGWSPQRVAQLRTELAVESLRASLGAPAPVPGGPPAGQVPAGTPAGSTSP